MLQYIKLKVMEDKSMKTTIITLFLFSTIFMAGCNNNYINTNTSESYIDQLFADLKDGNFELLNLNEDMLHNLVPENEEDNYFDDSFLYVIKDSIKNLEYNIISSYEENNRAAVTTEITIANLEHIFELTLLETIQLVLNEEQYIHSVSHGLLTEILLETYESGVAGTVTNIVNINLIKTDGQWSLENNNNHYFINAITGNLYGLLSGLDQFINILDDSLDLDIRGN